MNKTSKTTGKSRSLIDYLRTDEAFDRSGQNFLDYLSLEKKLSPGVKRKQIIQSLTITETAFPVAKWVEAINPDGSRVTGYAAYTTTVAGNTMVGLRVNDCDLVEIPVDCITDVSLVPVSIQ